MYTKFFNFKDNPFRQTPDPEYLFLSKSHEEALTHLIFTVSQGEGHIMITGEAGTGKTTLCKAFLGNLDNPVKAAYVSCPKKMDALKLLTAVNGEFWLDSAPDSSEEELTDRLRDFLEKKKAAGEKILLVIDDAQNLSPDGVHKLATLSGLEADQGKLLQVVLAGKPVLETNLSAGEAEQLRERVSKKCALVPLTFDETQDYIRNRIAAVSGKKPPQFDKATCRVIYEYSRGFPQLINSGCATTLQTACDSNNRKITGTLAREAINELTGKKPASGYARQKPSIPFPAVAGGVLVVLIAVAVFYFTMERAPESPVISSTANSNRAVAVNTEAPEADSPEITNGTGSHFVHVGSFVTASQANWRVKELQSLGFPSYMNPQKNNEGKTVYLVVAGRYRSQVKALEASRDLTRKGHFNFIVKPEDSPAGEQQ